MKHNRKRGGRRPRTSKHNEMHGGAGEWVKNKLRTGINTPSIDRFLRDWVASNDPNEEDANQRAGRELRSVLDHIGGMTGYIIKFVQDPQQLDTMQEFNGMNGGTAITEFDTAVMNWLMHDAARRARAAREQQSSRARENWRRAGESAKKKSRSSKKAKKHWERAALPWRKSQEARTPPYKRELQRKIKELMVSTGADEKSCREALIESRLNKQWAEMIIHAPEEPEPELDAEALASAAETVGKPVEEMRSKIVSMMKSTGADEKLCREALIESSGNRRWAEMIINQKQEPAAEEPAAEEPELDAEALSSAAETVGKPVEEMRSKLVAMMASTGADERLCREALIESRGNKLWAEQIINDPEKAQGGGKRRKGTKRRKRTKRRRKKRRTRTKRKRY